MVQFPGAAVKAANAPLPSEEYVEKAMPHRLKTLDMTTTFLMIIFSISLVTSMVGQGTVGIIYLVIGAVAFFLPCVIAAAQLGHLFPHDGSLYNWTYKTLGGYWSLFCAFCLWISGIQVMIGGSHIVVAYLQGLNPRWLTTAWQQGTVIIALILFSAILAVQRYRTVQYIVNVITSLQFLAVLLVATSAVVWLLTGHHSVGSFVHLSDWSLNPASILLFGIVVFPYFGAEVPLTMAGEVAERKAITRHLLWGPLIIIASYLICAFALLIVCGPRLGSVTPFALVTVADIALGTWAGDIVAVCMMLFLIIVPVVYTYTFARILLVASSDGHLPRRLGLLNGNRIPANAIALQTVIAVLLIAFAFIIAPAVFHFSGPGNFLLEMYTVNQAAATVSWSIATLFLFINLFLCFGKKRESFEQQRLFPMLVIWVTIVLGTLSCLLAMGDTLFFSWLPQMSNGQWLSVVGILVFTVLIIATIGSMLASNEGAWERAMHGS